MTDHTTQLVPVNIPGTSVPILATTVDGKPFVPLKPMCQALGMDVDSQRRKLASSGWATTVLITAVADDGRDRGMVALDADHIPMWLATIHPSRVSDAVRPTLKAFQREAVGALRDYFYNGGAINPKATEHQVNALIFQSRARMELLQAAKGLIRDEHLEAKARVVLAAGLGDVPVLESGERALLYTSDFLKGKNLSAKQTKGVASVFGKRVVKAYLEEHGREPGMYPMNLPNGQTRDVRAYTEADRPLLEQVWSQYYAEVTA